MIAFKQIYLSMGWRNIWRNKRRTLITMSSVVFAVVLAILLNSIKEGMLQKMQENAVTFYSGAIQIQDTAYWADKNLDNTFVPSAAQFNQILEHPRVTAAASRLESFALVASEEYTKGVMLLGIVPEEESKITFLRDKLIAGDYINDNDQSVMVAAGLAEHLRLGVGDTLVIIGQGYHGQSAVGKYPIKGLIKMPSPDLNKRLVYLPLPLAQQLTGAEGRVTSLVLKLSKIEEATVIADELSAKLPDLAVMDWKALMPELNQTFEGERAENVIFLGVLYLLISFGIFGTMLMMLMERQFEFGVLVAIGMRKLRLAFVVLLENVFISTLGAIVGTLISIPIVFYLNRYPITVGDSLKEVYENFGFEPIFYFSIEPSIFYNQTLIVFGIALLLSIYPIFKLLRLEPIPAMRK